MFGRVCCPSPDFLQQSHFWFPTDCCYTQAREVRSTGVPLYYNFSQSNFGWFFRKPIKSLLQMINWVLALWRTKTDCTYFPLAGKHFKMISHTDRKTKILWAKMVFLVNFTQQFWIFLGHLLIPIWITAILHNSIHKSKNSFYYHFIIIQFQCNEIKNNKKFFRHMYVP